METIKQDFLGLWVNAGGWVARPLSPAEFEVGQQVKTYHFGGTTKAGIGKDLNTKRGQYKEYWTTTGVMSREINKLARNEIKRKFEFYIALKV